MRRALALALALTAASMSVPIEPAEARTFPAAVSRWRDEARDAGWPAALWPWLACIIKRESRGDPHAANRRDPHGGSFGLTQINGVWFRPLMRAGIIRWPHDLYNPTRNLRAALYVRRHQHHAWGRRPPC